MRRHNLHLHFRKTSHLLVLSFLFAAFPLSIQTSSASPAPQNAAQNGAQNGATIQGSLTDPSDAAVSGAAINLLALPAPALLGFPSAGGTAIVTGPLPGPS